MAGYTANDIQKLAEEYIRTHEQPSQKPQVTDAQMKKIAEELRTEIIVRWNTVRDSKDYNPYGTFISNPIVLKGKGEAQIFIQFTQKFLHRDSLYKDKAGLYTAKAGVYDIIGLFTHNNVFEEYWGYWRNRFGQEMSFDRKGHFIRIHNKRVRYGKPFVNDAVAFIKNKYPFITDIDYPDEWK